MRVRLKPLLWTFLAAQSIIILTIMLLNNFGPLRTSPPRDPTIPEDFRLDIPITNCSSGDSCSKQHQMSGVCADTTCGEIFLQEFMQQKQPLVPEIRHILWKSEYVSKYFSQQLKSWKRIHPNWTYILWRDSDLQPFVYEHFPGKIYQKFRSLPTTGMHSVKRIDMFRYMLLYKFGGVYADLDYTLVSSLDTYRRYPAVVTREPEVHAAQLHGLRKWPLPIVASPAFFMAAPGHPFFIFALHQLVERDASMVLEFAGPFGLSQILIKYYQIHKAMALPAEFVYIPPSFSFYQYSENWLNTSGSDYLVERIKGLKIQCQYASDSSVPQVQQFCKDVLNLDAITDKNQPLLAIHDMEKKQPLYGDASDEAVVSIVQHPDGISKIVKLGDAFV